MKNLLFACAALCMFLAWMLPIHYRPWATYTGELYAFFALFALAAVFLKEKIQLPKIALPLVGVALIPLIQFAFGQVYYFSIALLGFLYVFAFWLSICIGFSLSKSPHNRDKTFDYLSYTFLVGGVCTGLVAICQWLNLDASLTAIMMNISGSTRPFANFAQPNNMGTFLLMALMACLYLYEKKALATKWLVVAALPILMGVALSQSRTSWVACLCIFFYLSYQQYRGFIRLPWRYNWVWLLSFIGLIFCLPEISQWIAQSSSLQIIESRELAERAGGDMSRLAIWQQMAHAVMAQPWLGYGWYQTSSAFVSISDTVQGPVWIRSAHNFILDFLLWNGAFIAVPFFIYIAYWLYQLQKHAHSVASIIGLLMVGIFLVHTMLEFPQNYAYFLLPIGFLLGSIQAQKSDTAVFTLPPIFMRIVFAIGVILIAVIYRDYDVLVPRLSQTMRYEHTPEKITRHDQIYLLSEFERRIDMIQQNPYQKMSKAELDDVEKLVRSYPTKYHLIKYAKMLAYNGDENEAKHQLSRLEKIHKQQLSYHDLIKDMPK